MNCRFREIALFLLLSRAGGWAVLEPVVVEEGQELLDPLFFTGAVEVDAPAGGYYGVASGAVAAHPRLVLSCAHLVYEEGTGWLGNGTSRWFQHWNRSGKPTALGARGLTLTGYYKFDGYADLVEAEPDSSSPATFAKDYVVFYHASQDTAGGRFAPFLEGGAQYLLTPSTVKKPVWKQVSGYPSEQYSSEEPGKYRLHQTAPFTNRATVRSSSFLKIDGVTTYGGNSGGPIWGWTNNQWAHAGVVVSSDRASNVGVVGNHADGTGLIFSALNDHFPSSVAQHNRFPAPTGGAIPDLGTLGRSFAVANLLGTVAQVRLHLDIRHERRGDLMISLQSPNRTTVTVLRPVPVRNSSPANLVTNLAVSGFLGQRANGTWKISIKDSYVKRRGSLVAASVEITTR
jgi:hypothetical protein